MSDLVTKVQIPNR